MTIQIWFKNARLPRLYENVLNSYQEDEQFCLQFQDLILKYPIFSIFKIVEFSSEDTVKEQ